MYGEEGGEGHVRKGVEGHVLKGRWRGPCTERKVEGEVWKGR